MREPTQQAKVEALVYKMEAGFRKLGRLRIDTREYQDIQQEIRALNMAYYNLMGQYYRRKISSSVDIVRKLKGDL